MSVSSCAKTHDHSNTGGRSCFNIYCRPRSHGNASAADEQQSFRCCSGGGAGWRTTGAYSQNCPISTPHKDRHETFLLPGRSLPLISPINPPLFLAQRPFFFLLLHPRHHMICFPLRLLSGFVMLRWIEASSRRKEKREPRFCRKQ